MRIEQLKTKLLRELVVGLSASDLGTGIADMLPSTLCKIQAILGMYFPIASFIYTDGIGLMIYLSVRGTHTKNDLYPLIKYFHIMALMIPLIICVIISEKDVAGPSDSFGTGVCWIPYEHKEWRLLGGKVIEWLSWIFVLTTYFTTLYRIQRLDIPLELRATSRKMLFIPAIFVILRVPSAIRTLHDYILGERPMMWLSVLQAFGDYGQGFANGIWFVCFQQEVRREIHSYMFGPKHDRITTESETTEIAEMKNPASDLITAHGDTEQSYHSFPDILTQTQTVTSITRVETSSIDSDRSHTQTYGVAAGHGYDRHGQRRGNSDIEM